MRIWVLALSGATLGAIAGALLALQLEVGANTNCSGPRQQEVAASCAVPTAAPWAVALFAVAGAIIAAAAVAALSRRGR